MVTDYHDPGWGPALRRWPMFFLPMPTFTFPVLQRRGVFDGLTAFRILWASFVTPLFVFLLTLAIIRPTVGTPDAGHLAVLLALQALALGGVIWARSRSLDASSEDSLAASYRTQFFVATAFASSTALFGVVGVFLVEGLWPYLEALPLGMAELVLVAPTR